METKTCSKCRKTKDVEEFTRDKTKNDGWYSSCKQCKRLAGTQYRESHKEELLEKQRESRIQNREEINKKQKEWRKKNNFYETYMRDYVEKNREKIRQRKKEYDIKYRSENSERLKTGKVIRNQSKASYDTYSHKLTIDECATSDADGFLKVKCTYCGRYFYPTTLAVTARIASLEGIAGGECRLYCSDSCKLACPVFNKRTVTLSLESDTSREVQPELRKLRLELDSYICQKCGLTIDEIELHCHHIDPVRRNPVESADLDNCITFCIDCHHEVHGYKWCKTRCI